VKQSRRNTGCTIEGVERKADGSSVCDGVQRVLLWLQDEAASNPHMLLGDFAEDAEDQVLHMLGER
jgi:hypothetical protein